MKKLKESNKIQGGKITYSDLNKPGETFFSKKYMLAGKPDYIVKRKNRYLPVEVKTGNYDQPQFNHVLQLAAYCHLLEENYGGFVPYGILVYSDKDYFRIPFDPRIRYELESTIKKMWNVLKTGRVIVNHSDFRKCQTCSMRRHCNVNIC